MTNINNIIGPYYGLDWLGMALSLLGVYLLGNKNRNGFLSFILANILWVILGVFFMKSVGIVIGNLAFLGINIRGYARWM
jgi:hypothetical protein